MVLFPNQAEVTPPPLPTVPPRGVPQHSDETRQTECLVDGFRRNELPPIGGVHGPEVVMECIELRETRVQAVQEILETEKRMTDICLGQVDKKAAVARHDVAAGCEIAVYECIGNAKRSKAVTGVFQN